MEIFYNVIDTLITKMEIIAKITLNSAYNKKKYAEILLHYMWLFIKGNVLIGE